MNNKGAVYVNLKWFIVLMLPMSACQQQKMSAQEVVLTSNGRGKYWDLVYENVDDSIIDVARVRRNSVRKVIDYCDYFEAGNKAMHYRNIDAGTVVEKGVFGYLFNPDKYKMINGYLIFERSRYKVLALTDEVLVIKTVAKNGIGTTKVYLPRLCGHLAHPIECGEQVSHS